MTHSLTIHTDDQFISDDLPVVFRISSDTSSGSFFDTRADEFQFRFHSVRAVTLRQGLYFLATFDAPPKLVIIDYQIIEDTGELLRDIIVTISTILAVRFPENSARVAVSINRPLRRDEIKRLRDCNISGLILSRKSFDQPLNQQSYSTLLDGGEHWPREAVETVAKSQPENNDDPVTLTDRQKEVQQLLCERGLSNKSIARQLNISESTVKIHVSAILKRYGVRNRTQLALAVNNGARL